MITLPTERRKVEKVTPRLVLLYGLPKAGIILHI